MSMRAKSTDGEQRPLCDQPIYSGATPAQVAADLANLINFQADGVPLDTLERMIAADLAPHLMRYDQPGFQSMFNAFPSPEAKLGAQTALAYNQGVTNWQVSPGGAMLEELCGQALCRLFGLNAGADATFMYSGTYGNQQALYMALHRCAERQGFDLAQQGIAGFIDPQRLAILTAKGAHFSVKQAVRMLGLGERCLVHLPVDADGRIDGAALPSFVEALARDRDIVCMVATAGSTSTGAVDPIAIMADLCAQTGAWLHVDGAYGYAYKLVPERAHLFAGDERADSIVWDPHKQLGAPIPNSVLFVRDRREFGRMTVYSDYFNRAEDVEPNPGLKSPPSTRPMSALPLVTILRGQGLTRVVDTLRASLREIRELAEYVDALDDVERCHHPDLGILCFRITPAGCPDTALDELQRRLYARVMANGERSISITRLRGYDVLRLVSVSPQITLADLRSTIEQLRVLAAAMKK